MLVVFSGNVLKHPEQFAQPLEDDPFAVLLLVLLGVPLLIGLFKVDEGVLVRLGLGVPPVRLAKVASIVLRLKGRILAPQVVCQLHLLVLVFSYSRRLLHSGMPDLLDRCLSDDQTREQFLLFLLLAFGWFLSLGPEFIRHL